VKILGTISTLAFAATTLAGGCAATAQQSFYGQLRRHNASMTDVQPTWMGPLIQSDSRLGQGIKLSVSDAHAPGAEMISYGNNKGISTIVDRRFQFDFDPPSYFRNHSAVLKDGFGNTATQVKYRIASGNAEHGNFAVTAILYRSFTPGSNQNGMLTGAYFPKLAAGKAFGWFNVQSVVSGVLPTGKIALQGRAVEWNLTGQVHASSLVWLDVENNALFNYGGPSDGKTQNFVTPVGFYVVRRKEWQPTHPVLVLATGMQIATSSFHTYNHNLISELRIIF
jgi:hypothetical protein